MTRTLRTSLYGVMVLTAALLACKTGDKTPEAEKAPASAKPADSTQPTDADMEDMAAGKKMGKYVYCLNYVSQRAFESIRRYDLWVDWDKGPTGKETNPYAPYTIEPSNLNICKKNIAEAKAMKPDLGDVDKLVVDYEAKLDALVPKVKAAFDYYDQKKYKDDKFAEGKTMHKPLVDAYEAFKKAHNEFNKAFSVRSDALEKKAIERLERMEGKKLGWHHRKLISEAKELLHAGEFEQGKWDQLDATKYGAAIDKFEAFLKQVEEYCEKNAAEKAKFSSIDRVIKESKDFMKAARDMWRRKKDKKTVYTATEKMLIRRGFARQVEGNPQNVILQYNELIDASNAMF